MTLRPDSPCIDAGRDGGDPNSIGPDVTDVNDDFDAAQELPWDVQVRTRRVAMPSVSHPNDPNDVTFIVDCGSFEQCVGDVDGDGDVDLADLARALTCFGLTTCVGECCWPNFIFSATDPLAIDLGDLAVVLANFGSQCRISPENGGGGFAGEGDLPRSGDDSDEVPGQRSGPSDDPFVQWLRSRTVDELLDWYRDGMPH